MSLRKIARRTLLLGGVALAGGAAFGWWRYARAFPNPLEGGGAGTAFSPWIAIGADGVTIVTPRAEMGQGVQSTLAALAAEELGIDPEAATVTHGEAALAYYNEAILREGLPFAAWDEGWLPETARSAMAVPAKWLAIQATGGSSSMPDAFERMRKAGAAARIALTRAAAARWGADEAALRVEGGAVVHPDGGRLAYEALAADAATLAPDDPPLKPASEWRLLGKSRPRLDVPPKVEGRATYGLDIRPDLFAVVRRNPNLRAGVVSVDEAAARALPGVEDVVRLPDGAAVVGRTTWHAMRGADALTFEWEGSAHADPPEARLRAAFDGDPDSTFREEGEPDDVTATVEAEYAVPFLAHATLEPMNATARLADGRLWIAAGCQLPTGARERAAAIAGLDEDAVTVEVPYLGGGYGRRAETDFVEVAVRVALALPGRTVQTMWDRTEDLTHDVYRPAAIARMRGAVEGERATLMDARVASFAVMESQLGRLDLPTAGPDATIVQGGFDQPYAIPNRRWAGYRATEGLPVGSWRSVGASFNGFFHDAFVDELAHAAGADPVAFRLAHLSDAPSRAVLEHVAAMAGWGETGRALGCAFVHSFGVPTAAVVEVDDEDGAVRLTRAWIAGDVGTALDPANCRAQLMGGLAMGLGAAMHEAVPFEAGRAQVSNFHDYPLLRIGQCPKIEAEVLSLGGKLRGIGEPGLPPAAPALANAIFTLTGKRHRRLPLRESVRFA